MGRVDFKDRVKALVRRAQERCNLTSYDALGARLGVRAQSIANAIGKSRDRDMLSKPLLDELAAMAELSAAERDEFDAAWLEWKLERSNDGGVGEFLLGVVRGKLKGPELKKVIKKATDLRHQADRTGRP